MWKLVFHRLTDPALPGLFIKNKKIGLIALCLLPGICARGMLDENGNGVSDIWEAIHGTFAEPDADWDEDGFTNAQEAAAGTNPYDPDDAPVVSMLDLTEPERIRSEIRTASGVRYQLYVSTDLTTWYPVGPSVRGEGGVQEVNVDLEGAATTGNVVLCKWSDLDSGANLSTVRDYADIGSVPPDLETQITELDVRRSSPDEDDFGLYIRGWIVAEETGPHTFWIAGDDRAELWLSPNAEPTALYRVLDLPGYTGYQQWTKYPEQQSDPVNLVEGTYYYFEVFHKEWGGGDHVSVAWTKPSDAPGTRTIIGGETLSTLGVSLDSLMEVEGKAFFRFDVLQPDTDGDGLTDFEEEVLGLDSDFQTTQPRRPDLEEAITRLNAGHTLSIGVSQARAYESTGAPAEWVIFRTGSIEPLTVNLSYSGSADSGSDYTALPTTVSFPAGATSMSLRLFPLADHLEEGQEQVVASLLPGTGYTLGSLTEATVVIDDAPDDHYQAILRPGMGILTGQGVVTLRKKGNDEEGWWNLRVSDLSSPQTGATLYLSTDQGVTGVDFLELPLGKIVDLSWEVEPENGITQSEMLTALDAGQIWIRISTETHPTGEVFGRLGSGTTGFVPHVPPAAAVTLPADSGERSRFLMQATFGPRYSDLDGWGDQTYEEWVDAQMALNPTYHLPYVQARRAERLAQDGSDGWQTPRQEAFWQYAVTAEDQLRQRMAFALSQIFVISQNGALAGDHEEVTAYYDLLVKYSFGNYRDLLEEVTLSTMMGIYLSMLRNQKPNRETGHEPDENYAREIMQLFSIGLVQLHPDGTPKLDEEGQPLPTYTQEDIVGLAHIFTGWGPHYDEADPPTWSNGTVASKEDWFRYGNDRTRPMTFYADFHDQEDRVIVGDTLIPGGLSGEQRMDLALDTIFHHPNVGPFMAKQLIQRFVSSNPSPAYVARVAAVFDDNGSGVRGDLGATLKAVLLDAEARNPDYRIGHTRGKPFEPVLRMSRLLRASELVPARSSEGDSRLFLNFQYEVPEQAPLKAPSVFNFFQPGYKHPGAIDAAGVLSPEFQIFSETTAINLANFMYGKVFSGFYTGERDLEDETLYTGIDWSRWIDILNTPTLTPTEAQTLLLDELNDLLLGGSMSDVLRQNIMDVYAELPAWFGYEDHRQEDRVQVAWYLILTSPEAFVLR